MNLNTRFVEIAKGLLQKTKEGKIAWEKDDAPNRAFRFRSPQFSFFLNLQSPPTEPDYVDLHIFGPNGEDVESWKVYEGDDGWQAAHDLYFEVRRKVLKLDKVLEDVERFIASK